MKELSVEEQFQVAQEAEAYILATWAGTPPEGGRVALRSDAGDFLLWVREYGGQPTPRPTWNRAISSYIATQNGVTHCIAFSLFIDGAESDLMVECEYDASSGAITIDDIHVL